MSRGKVSVPLDLPQPGSLSDGSRVLTKQESAYEALRGAILEKLLPAGSQLPSTRTLAQRWSLSRGTVEMVFDRLRSEGYVTRVSGSGTRVSAVVPDLFIRAPQARAALQAREQQTPAAPPPALEIAVRVGQPFVARLADPALFPIRVWSRAVAKAMAEASAQLLCSPDPGGMLALREQIADYLAKYRGIRCKPDDLIVTTGIRHSLDLVARSVVTQGDKVCVEDPGYLSAKRIFSMAGARLVYIPVLEDGIDDGALREHGDARLVYVTPAHQSPLGVTLSVSRRLALLDWASRTDAWVVEDDYDSEFNYNSAPLAALKSLDRDDRVIYCGSFNKTLFAGLRVGFMLVPGALRNRLLATLQTTGRSVGVTEQAALAEYMRSGAFVRYLRSARQAYQERRDALLACLAEQASGGYSVSGQHAGLHFVLELLAGSDESDFCRRASAIGLALQPVSEFCQEVRRPAAVMIGFTALSLSQIRFSGRKLGQLLAGQAVLLASGSGVVDSGCRRATEDFQRFGV
ncbi:PLP-dependent aminotransferase family protein [Pseudomonas helvetica]|uniref:MocR-like pyridoxine biosynthesis transcription factor PdxR n=1 Tax=Pseudomonas helvetica TaxID=3136738 RepID=UPI003267863C